MPVIKKHRGLVSIGILTKKFKKRGVNFSRIRVWIFRYHLIKPVRRHDPTNPRSYWLFNYKKASIRIAYILYAKDKLRLTLKEIKEAMKGKTTEELEKEIKAVK